MRSPSFRERRSPIPSPTDSLGSRPRRARWLVAALALGALASLTAPAHADDRTEARRHFRAGMEYIKRGRYDDAIRELKRANEILPHPNVVFNIAETYARAGKLEEAIQAYDEYLASDPPDRADVLLVEQDLKKKVQDAKRTEEGRAHFRAGMDLIAKHQYDEGIRELQRANEIQPHPAVTFNIARAYAEQGDLEKAIASYRDYLASSPPDAKQVQTIVADLQTRLDAQRAATAAANPTQPGAGAGNGNGAGNGATATPGKTDTGTAPPAKSFEPAAKDAFAATKSDSVAVAGQERTEDVYQETVVTASRGAQSPLDAPNSTTIITRQDIRLSGHTRIPELLRRVAGIDVMQITGGDTNVSMRGFNSRFSNKLLVLVNGRAVNNDILGSTLWETLPIDVDQIERIEVVRGPGSALYGADAFAGVVNIITIAPGEGKPGFRAGYGDHEQTYGSVWTSGRDGDFAYRASAGYTYYPRWTREVAPGRADIVDTGTDQNLGVQNMRIDLRGSERVGKNAELYAGGGYARGAIDIYGIGPFNDYGINFENSDVTAGFKSEHFNVRAYWTRLGALAQANPVYVGHTTYEVTAIQNSLDTEAEYTNSFKFPEALHHDFHVGLGYRLKSIQWGYLADDTPLENHASAFLQDEIRIGKWFQIVGSGRVDYVPYLGRIVGSPRGSIIIHPTERQAIRFSGSTAFRTPTFLESYLDLPIQLSLPGVQLVSASKPLDNPNFKLEPEHVTSGEVGYLNQQSDFFEFEVNGYYNQVRDLIVLADARPATLSNRAAGVEGIDPSTGRYTAAFGGWANECDIYHVFGGEVGTRVYPVEGLDLFANYAINYSNQERPAGCTVPDDRRTSHHKVNAGIQVRTKMGLNGELAVHWQSPETWREQVATATGIEWQSFDLPAYTLVNARLGYRFLKDHAEVSATVFNAFADVFTDSPQMHPFGNRIGRRVMGFFTYSL